MPQSLSNVLIHLVYSTRERRPWLTAEICERLAAYQVRTFDSLGYPVVKIQAVDDHIHALVQLSRTQTISGVTERVKAASSRWVKSVCPRLRDFSWQAGYGVFSVSASDTDRVRHYIANQAQHHRRMSFDSEYIKLLTNNKIEFNRNYLFG